METFESKKRVDNRDRSYYYQKNKFKINLRSMKWAKNNKEKCEVSRIKWKLTPSGIYQTLKQNALHCAKKEKGLCSRDEFVNWYRASPKKCVYCDLTEDLLNLEIRKPTHGKKGKRLSIDRKDNTKGYVLGNMVISCLTCNFTKNNVFTYEEMLKIGQKYIKPKWKLKEATLQK